MENPTSFKYKQFEVYSAKEVYNYDPVFFKNHKISEIVLKYLILLKI